MGYEHNFVFVRKSGLFPSRSTGLSQPGPHLLSLFLVLAEPVADTVPQSSILADTPAGK